MGFGRTGTSHCENFGTNFFGTILLVAGDVLELIHLKMKRLSNIEMLSSEAAKNVGNQTLRKQSNSGGKQCETIFEKRKHQNHAWWKDHFGITFVDLLIRKNQYLRFLVASGIFWKKTIFLRFVSSLQFQKKK